MVRSYQSDLLQVMSLQKLVVQTKVQSTSVHIGSNVGTVSQNTAIPTESFLFGYKFQVIQANLQPDTLVILVCQLLRQISAPSGYLAPL